MLFTDIDSGNGHKSVIEQIPDLHSFAIGFWIGCGSRNESKSEEGLAHLLEHMIFKGTKRRSALRIAQELDRLGMEMNAHTTQENTFFFIDGLKDDFDTGLKLIFELIFESQFPHLEFNREKQVIHEEMKMLEDNPEEWLLDQVFEKAYEGHPLAHNIAGNTDSLKKINRRSLTDFYKKHYTAANLCISIVSPFEHSYVQQKLKPFTKYFRRNKSNPGQSLSLPQFQTGEYTFNRKIEQAYVCLAAPSCSLFDEQRFAVSLLHRILGGGISSKLFQEIREKRGLAYSVYSSPTFLTDTGLFSIYANMSPKHLNQVLDLIHKEIQKMSKKGPSQKEWEAAKAQMKSHFIMGLESSQAKMHFNARSFFYYNKIWSVDEFLHRIEQVNREDIIRLSQQLFKNLLCLKLVP